ncbi:hypothetical protein L7F22_014335 [Adiantum nelumboides]|nr:hypothetical protein [Adiantum nelumboides]
MEANRSCRVVREALATGFYGEHRESRDGHYDERDPSEEGTWDSPNEQISEMPTGGAAILRSGPNRKEQCLAQANRLCTNVLPSVPQQ